MARPGPVRDGENVVLRPFEGLIADGRAPLPRDHEADHIIRGAFGARRCGLGEARGGDADLFMVTDKSAFERLDLVREEME